MIGFVFIVFAALVVLLYYQGYSNIILNDQLYISPDNVYVKVIYKTLLYVTVSTTEDCYDVDIVQFLLFYRKNNS